MKDWLPRSPGMRKEDRVKEGRETFCMAMWQMEVWDNRAEDEQFWRRVKGGAPWMRQKQRTGVRWHRELKE